MEHEAEQEVVEVEQVEPECSFFAPAEVECPAGCGGLVREFRGLCEACRHEAPSLV